MDRLLYTFYVNIKFYLRDYLLIPLLIVALFCIFKIIYDFKKGNKSGDFVSYFLFRVKNKIFLLKSIFSLYLLININATVFSRLRLERLDPLSNIWGGWWIESNKYFFDFSVVWNILMFLPMCSFVFFYDRYIRKKERTYFQTTVISTIISFFNSLIIEIMQIIFKTGTFQVSDLVYNTLGGFLGIFVLLIIIRLINFLIINTPYLKNRYRII